MPNPAVPFELKRLRGNPGKRALRPGPEPSRGDRYSKRTLGDPASLPRPRGRSKAYCGSARNTRLMIGAASPAATPTTARRAAW
jgi:hypothetical protein